MRLKYGLVIAFSIISAIAAVYMAYETVKSMGMMSLVVMTAFVICCIVYFFIRVRYEKNHGQDIIAEMKKPYEPWMKQEEKCRQLDLEQANKL